MKVLRYLARKFADYAVYPLSGMSKEDFAESRETRFENIRNETLRLLNGQQIVIAAKDGRTLDAVWAECQRSDRPTVILCHGNGMILDDLAGHALFFKLRELNTLLMTMGGYPNSSEQYPPNELSGYRDVQAAVDEVKKRTRDGHNGRILVYGISIGGALAFHAGAADPGLHVISDQTFTDIVSVAEHLFPFGAKAAKSAIKEKFPIGEKENSLITDGFDNLAKAKKLQGSYLGIYSAGDRLMRASDGRNYTEELAEAYLEGQRASGNPDLALESLLVEIPGGHCSSFTDSREACQKIAKHLEVIFKGKLFV